MPPAGTLQIRLIYNTVSPTSRKLCSGNRTLVVKILQAVTERFENTVHVCKTCQQRVPLSIFIIKSPCAG